MRLRQLVNNSAPWRSLLLGTLLLFGNPISAKKDAPGVKSTKWEHQPENLQYFEDSDVIVFQDYVTNNIIRSTNAGETWDTVKAIPDGKAYVMYLHPFDSKRAYVLSQGKKHWTSKDRGETWDEFTTEYGFSQFRKPLAFHAGDADRVIFNAQDCQSIFCEELAMYTIDGFKTSPKVLREDTSSCYWAKSTKLFTTGQEDLDKNRILCVTKGKYSPWRKDFRFLISDDFFQKSGSDVQEFEPDLEPGRTVQGVINMAVVQSYLVAAAMSSGTDELALYVSDDTIKWHRAVFPHDHKMIEEAYTILESTKYSIQVDVMNTRPSNPMGVLLSSNSNGTYFTRLLEHTNRNLDGLVDFEKLAGVQGIVMVNTVDNWKDVEEKVGQTKKVISQVSFDDGREWNELKVGGEKLNVHLVTEMQNVGRILSSPAPGLVMATGNTGDYLKGLDRGNLYVSDDAGLTWSKGLDGPHKYEFGDQGSVLIAIPEGATDHFSYSLNHGKKWIDVELPEKKFHAQILTTTQDSTSLKFILVGGIIDDNKKTYFTIAIDFEEMHERKCGDGDTEKWYARVDKDGKASCLMGHKQYYNRRKADAECFLKQEFEDPVAGEDKCECNDDVDFECDFNFVRSDDRKSCELAPHASVAIPNGQCKTADATFKGSSGWRLIPGNNCERKKGAQKDDLIDRKCSGNVPPPASGKIAKVQHSFDGAFFSEIIYRERAGKSDGDDETIIARTSKNQIYLSKDHGKKWEEILKDEKIQSIYPHPHQNDVIYFITQGKKVFYSVDRGHNIREFGVNAPTFSDEDHFGPTMSFHPKYKDWIIWTGVRDKDCVGKKGDPKGDCHGVASLTKDRGDNWQTIRRYVKKCEFPPEAPGQNRSLNLIFCASKEKETLEDENNPWQLVSSTDFFEKETRVDLNEIVGFATMSEFIIAAAKDQKQNLKVDASVDGFNFAEAIFPLDFQVPHQSGYTVLESSTHSAFLLVTVENDPDYKYGSIIKSNSNGTSYVLSLGGVNQNKLGYADFEKMAGIEGVALANVVSNTATAKDKDKTKMLKTKITHNDAADWALVPPPLVDSAGKGFGCSGNIEKCSLHIHGYTERIDRSRTFSSASSIGLMFGIGNVGEFLGAPKDADTYMTADAGLSWRQVQKGSNMWSFLDQGSIVILIKDKEKTDSLSYSRDEGRTWIDYQFADSKLQIIDMTTVPSDTSRNLVLWVKTDDGLAAINVDFSGLTDRQCKLDESNSPDQDYYLWTPQHPMQNNDCLFGHVSQYHRKKVGSDCFNGALIDRLHNIREESCPCERRDFECDYNYIRQSEGICTLVKGMPQPEHLQECFKDPHKIMYHDPSGYRRIPLTTCTNEGGKGLALDETGDEHPCPGKEEQYRKSRAISGVVLLLAIVIPIVAAAGIGYWVYNNWTNNFGQIRLGESSHFDDQAPYIKYPVMAISAVVALAIALPSLVSALWKEASKLLGRRSTRFTTRSSFARDSDYAAVDEDEGELLGDESDDEV